MSDGRVAFGRDDVGRDLTDTEFLVQIAWRETGSADLRQAAAAGRLDRFWRAWSKGLAARADVGSRAQPTSRRTGRLRTVAGPSLAALRRVALGVGVTVRGCQRGDGVQTARTTIAAE